MTETQKSFTAGTKKHKTVQCGDKLVYRSKDSLRTYYLRRGIFSKQFTKLDFLPLKYFIRCKLQCCTIHQLKFYLKQYFIFCYLCFLDQANFEVGVTFIGRNFHVLCLLKGKNFHGIYFCEPSFTKKSKFAEFIFAVYIGLHVFFFRIWRFSTKCWVFPKFA